MAEWLFKFFMKLAVVGFGICIALIPVFLIYAMIRGAFNV